jgi:hypothetical protein
MFMAILLEMACDFLNALHFASSFPTEGRLLDPYKVGHYLGARLEFGTFHHDRVAGSKVTFSSNWRAR